MAGPSRDTHSSSGLGGRHIFMGDSGPRECCGRDWDEELRARVSEAVKATPSTLGTGTPLIYAAVVWRRLPRQRLSSNGWPVCITRKSSGTSFRASEQTALVPGTPRARIASYSGR